MKKKCLLTLTLAVVVSLSAFAYTQTTFGVSEESANVTVACSSVITETIAKINSGESTVFSNDLFEYSLVLATHTNTNTYQISETFSEKAFDLVSGSGLKINGWTKPESPTALSGSPYGPYVASNQIRFNYVEGVAFKVVAKDNIKLTVTHPAISGIATSDNVIKIRTYKGGSRLAETPLYDGTNTSKEENFFGGEYTLTSGETFYFEYGCSGAYEKTLNSTRCFLPTFTAESYEEKDVTLTYADMFSQVTSAGSCAVDKSTYSFEFAYGEIGNLKTPVISGNTIKSTELNSNDYAAVYSNGTFVRTLGESLKFFIKITAKANLNLTICNVATEEASSYKAYYENYYSDGTKTVRFGKTEVAKILEEDALTDTISLPVGSSYVLGVCGINEGTSIYQLPYFVLEKSESIIVPKIIDYTLNGGENSENNASVLYKGESTITLYSATKTGYDFIGWVHNGKIYSAGDSVAVTEDLTFKALYYSLTTIGGSIKLKSDDFKMRFVSKISAETLDILDELNVKYTLGTLLLPSDMKNGALTVGTTYVSDTEKMVWNGETDTEKQFNVLLSGFDVSGEITEIVKSRLDRSISARAYLKITLDGEEKIYYGNEIERSAYEIATSAYNDYKEEETDDYVNKVTVNGKEVYSKLTEEQIALLEKVLSAVKK